MRAAEYVTRISAIAEENEREVMQEEIDTQVDMLANWQLQSDKTRGREWDLNDPDTLKKDRPAREGDDDPRCGPSSMQMFDGEDLHKAEREARLLQEVCGRDAWARLPLLRLWVLLAHSPPAPARRRSTSKLTASRHNSRSTVVPRRPQMPKIATTRGTSRRCCTTCRWRSWSRSAATC